MGISKDNALKKIQDSQDAEFEVYTASEHKTFIDNLIESEVDTQIKGRVNEIHKKYDDDLFELTGKKRTHNQKTYDFLKEVIEQYQEVAKDSPELKKQIETLKEQIKNGEGAEQLKKDLEAIQKQFTQSKSEWESEKTELLSRQERTMIDNELDKALIGIKFKETIPENVRNVMIRQVKDNLIKSAKITEDKLIFLNKEGETLRNKENALNPFTAKEMLQEQLKEIIGEERKIQGTGVKPQIEKNKDGKKDIVLSVPDSIKTKGDLSGFLLSQGLTRDSDEYQVAYAKYSPDLQYEKV